MRATLRHEIHFEGAATCLHKGKAMNRVLGAHSCPKALPPADTKTRLCRLLTCTGNRRFSYCYALLAFGLDLLILSLGLVAASNPLSRRTLRSTSVILISPWVSLSTSLYLLNIATTKDTVASRNTARGLPNECFTLEEISL